VTKRAPTAEQRQREQKKADELRARGAKRRREEMQQAAEQAVKVREAAVHREREKEEGKREEEESQRDEWERMFQGNTSKTAIAVRHGDYPAIKMKVRTNVEEGDFVRAIAEGVGLRGNLVLLATDEKHWMRYFRVCGQWLYTVYDERRCMELFPQGQYTAVQVGREEVQQEVALLRGTPESTRGSTDTCVAQGNPSKTRVVIFFLRGGFLPLAIQRRSMAQRDNRLPHLGTWLHSPV
jgi:hypothetical protein